jgi:hypothetical protein
MSALAERGIPGMGLGRAPSAYRKPAIKLNILAEQLEEDRLGM